MPITTTRSFDRLASAPPFQGAVLLGEGRPFVAAAVFVAAEELSRLAATLGPLPLVRDVIMPAVARSGDATSGCK